MCILVWDNLVKQALRRVEILKICALSCLLAWLYFSVSLSCGRNAGSGAVSMAPAVCLQTLLSSSCSCSRLVHCCTLSLCYLGAEMIITEIQIAMQRSSSWATNYSQTCFCVPSHACCHCLFYPDLWSAEIGIFKLIKKLFWQTERNSVNKLREIFFYKLRQILLINWENTVDKLREILLMNWEFVFDELREILLKR